MLENILKFVESNKENTVNNAFVKALVKNFNKCASAIEITIKSMDEMLGLKVEFQYPQKETSSFESGVDGELLNASLMALMGNITALKHYVAKEHKVQKEANIKDSLLEELLIFELPKKAYIRTFENGKTMIEFRVQLGYRRYVKLYLADEEGSRTKLKDLLEISNQ